MFSVFPEQRVVILPLRQSWCVFSPLPRLVEPIVRQTERQQQKHPQVGGGEDQPFFFQIGLPIVVFSHNGSILKANPKFATMFGWSQENLQELRMRDVAVPSHRPRFDEASAALFRGELDSFKIDCPCNRLDGSQLWADITVSSILSHRGEIDCAVAVITDVTEAKRQYERVCRSEQRYQRIVDKAGQAIGVTNAAGFFIEVNTAFLKLFGYSREECLELTFLDITDPLYRQASEANAAALFRGEPESYRMEKAYRRKDGSMFWGDLTVHAIYTATSGVEAAVGVVVDITDRKKSEERLRLSEARFRAIFNNAGHAIAATMSPGHITEVNPAFESMFGYAKEEALRLTYLDITAEKSKEMSERNAIAVYNGELGAYRMEKQYRRKDGSLFWADVTVSPYPIPGTHAVGTVGVKVDITERKRVEAELKKAREELEIRVKERTEELADSNKRLLSEIAERAQAQESLRQSEERFRAIFESASDCVFIKDSSLRYMLVNPRMASLLELPAHKIIGRTDVDLFGAEAAHHLKHVDLRVLNGETVEEEHTRVLRHSPMTFLDIKNPMYDSEGRVVGICGISRNITGRWTSEPLVGDIFDQYVSDSMRHVRTEALRAARTNSNVLITGESGSGKDHLARFIHQMSSRSSGPFYSVNCGAIPSELVESELFGHERGAFTGAHKTKRGLIELAEGGTVLLNEIGDLHLPSQVKLLTFLDTFTFTRVGGENTRTVNVRVMAATNRDLEKEVESGRFRSDLFYRLNVLPIRLPSLREIPEDLPIIAMRIVDALVVEMRFTTKPEIRPEEMERLIHYTWPGNIRELRNVLERSIIVSEGPFLRFDFLDPKEARTKNDGWTVEFPPRPSLPAAMDDLKRQLIEEALNRTRGVKKEAAGLLGISRWTLLRQMTGVGLHVPYGNHLKEDDGE